MTAPTPAPDDADRRADRALFGGTPAGGTDGLPPDIDDEFARLAAALTAPPHDSPAPPAALVEAVKRDADAFFAPVRTVERAREPEKRPWWKLGKFTLGFAAGTAIAATVIALMQPVTAGRPRFDDLHPTAAWSRVASASGAVRVPIAAAGDEEADPVGEMVWAAGEQHGVMSLTGLAPNDPAESQYQLWIFDADRDERYPVDGGVFDVPVSGETVVPFAPRVPVGRATLFAVTVERPGGVVVSDRSRLPAVAKVPGA